MAYADVSILERELVNSAIMYAFIFAMIISSGLSMTISRYLADELFENHRENILASLVGVITVDLLTGGIIGAIFYIGSPLPVNFKILSYMLFIELSVLYLLMVYISAIKDYKKIAQAFGFGTILTVLLAILFAVTGMSLPLAILISIDIGFMVNMVIQMIAVRQAFYHMSNQVFDFTGTMIRMPRLFFINLFYTIGLFAHNFLFWRFSNLSIHLMKTFYYAPAYDIATFFSVLTILPATIIFVVKVETSFYDKYRDFCNAIMKGGTLKDIEQSKSKMIQILWRELSSIFEIQFIATVLMLVAGINLVLPLLGADNQTIELYSVLVIGYFLTYMAFIVVTILLYFDNQEDALKITGLFLATSTILTWITIRMGENFYGLGLGSSALVTLLVGIFFLNRTVNQIDYRLFSKQPLSRR